MHPLGVRGRPRRRSDTRDWGGPDGLLALFSLATHLQKEGVFMLVCTSWKARPLSSEQANRMMEIWGKIEADQAANSSVERVCWYIFGDGTGGFTVNRVIDVDAANAFGLELSVALGDFLELDSKIVLDLDSALPAIQKGFERLNS
jgi:hypothetical protein